MASQAVAARPDDFTILIEASTDADLRNRITEIENLLEQRKQDRQDAARKRALAILQEAGLDVLLTDKAAKKRGRKAKK